MSCEVLDRLPGNLRWNTLEIQPLMATDWVYPQLINSHVSPGTPDWSEGKIMCKECVLKLMGRCVLNSLRELRAQRMSPTRCLLVCLVVTKPPVQMNHSLKIAGMGTNAERRGNPVMRSSSMCVPAVLVLVTLDLQSGSGFSIYAIPLAEIEYWLPTSFPYRLCSHFHHVFFSVQIPIISDMYRCHVHARHTCCRVLSSNLPMQCEITQAMSWWRSQVRWPCLGIF